MDVVAGFPGAKYGGFKLTKGVREREKRIRQIDFSKFSRRLDRRIKRMPLFMWMWYPEYALQNRAGNKRA